MCRNRAKIRKTVGTAVNKILHNFSAHDQKQKIVDTSIPLITSALSSIVVHSTNVGFRSEVFQLMAVSDTRDYKKALKSTLWKVASEKHAVVSPKNSDGFQKKISPIGDQAHSSNVRSPESNLGRQAAEREHDSNTPTPSSQQDVLLPNVYSKMIPVTGSVSQKTATSDFDELGAVAPTHLSEAPCGTTDRIANVKMSTTNLSQGKILSQKDYTSEVTQGSTDVQYSNSRAFRRRLSEEFASHETVNKETVPINVGTSTNVLGLDHKTPSILDHFDFLGGEMISVNEDDGQQNDVQNIILEPLSSTLINSNVTSSHSADIDQSVAADWWDTVTWT